MKKLSIVISLLVLSNFCYSQFEKKEMLAGGSLNYLKTSTATSTFNDGSSERDIQFMPEFGYTVTKNLVVSVFGSLISQKYRQNSALYTAKTKGYTVGVAASKYRFFTKGFGLFLRLEGNYSPSTYKYYYDDGTFSPKEKYKITEINLIPGAVYRFTKHFSLQTLLGHASYRHITYERETVDDKQNTDQFNAGFYFDLRLTAFYIFK